MECEAGTLYVSDWMIARLPRPDIQLHRTWYRKSLDKSGNVRAPRIESAAKLQTAIQPSVRVRGRHIISRQIKSHHLIKE